MKVEGVDTDFRTTEVGKSMTCREEEIGRAGEGGSTGLEEELREVDKSVPCLPPGLSIADGEQVTHDGDVAHVPVEEVASLCGQSGRGQHSRFVGTL